jgi:56kDa selenium binding protein (SBP56)
MCRRLLLIALLLGCALNAAADKTHSYLFAWCGDDDKKASDFLAVIDADPASPGYGQVVATTPTGVAGSRPHHTEVEMPVGGLLMANGFEAGQTWVFDLREPLKPHIVASFGDLDGYMHPHTYFRLPNGNVLATFQYQGGHGPKADGGGLLEIDDHGRVLREGSAEDKDRNRNKEKTAASELIRPYSVELLPAADRVVSTNTAMHDVDGKSRTVQVWRFSTLRVLRTLTLPPGPRGDEQYYPGEPRLLDDGKSLLVHTFSCGLYLMRGVDSENPSLRFVYGFPGENCGVPLRIGHWWLATVPETHSLTVLDISDPEKPREVSRVTLDAGQKPHWVSADAAGTRIVLNSDENGPDHRLFIINFDPQTGSAKLDEHFRDRGSDHPGVSMDGKSWPHGFHGNAYAHGTVFSR